MSGGVAPDFAGLGLAMDVSWFPFTISIKQSDVSVENPTTGVTYVDVFTDVQADRVPVSSQKDAQMMAMYPGVTHKFLTRSYIEGVLPKQRIFDQDGNVYEVQASVSPGDKSYNRIYCKQLPGSHGA